MFTDFISWSMQSGKALAENHHSFGRGDDPKWTWIIISPIDADRSLSIGALNEIQDKDCAAGLF
jgi:hypothetical protein